MNSRAFFGSLSGTGKPSSVLTMRENQILSSLSQGLANKEIASLMNISVPTVRTHLRHIYEKIGARSRTEAIVKYFNQTRPAVASIEAIRSATNRSEAAGRFTPN